MSFAARAHEHCGALVSHASQAAAGGTLAELPRPDRRVFALRCALNSSCGPACLPPAGSSACRRTSSPPSIALAQLQSGCGAPSRGGSSTWPVRLRSSTPGAPSTHTLLPLAAQTRVCTPGAAFWAIQHTNCGAVAHAVFFAENGGGLVWSLKRPETVFTRRVNAER